MQRRLFGNVAALGIIQLTNYVVPFVVLIHLSRKLGIEIYGVLAFAQGIIAISIVFIDYGFALSATNKISKNRNNKLYVSKILGGILSVQFFIFLICATIILLFAFTSEKYSAHRLLIIFSIAPILIQSIMPSWFFQGIEKMKYFAAATITAKVFFAITIVLFIENPEDYIFVPFLTAIGQMIALVLAVVFIYRLGYKIKTPTLKVSIYCFKMSQHFFASRIAVASYMNGAILVLGMIAQPAVVAIYSMAEQLYKVMQSALGPAAAATYPYMTKEKDTALMFKLISGVVLLAITGACVGFFVAPALVAFVFDESWLATIPVFNVFLLAIVIHAGAIMTGYPLAALVGRLDVANTSVMTGAGVYFILLAIAFFSNSVTAINLAFIMMASELAVLLHRSFLLIPIALKNRQQNPQRGNIK
jgi:PST family polysaccharide transporter